MKRLLFSALAFCFVLGSLPAGAQSTPDASAAQLAGFSRALDMDEGHVFAGEPSNIHTPGRVYVFGEGADGGWTQQAALEAEDGSVGDSFGAALDVSGSTLVVGAPSVGAAYVFQRQDGSWTQTARLAPAEADSAESYGGSVAFADGQVFVGAQASQKAQMDDAGAVYVYEQQDGSWTEATALSSSEVPGGSGFGSALMASPDHLLVSAPQQEGGAVVAFRRDGETWNEVQTLQASNLGSSARFGSSLEWMGDTALVGAPRALGAVGSVHTYSYDAADSTWTSGQRLMPFDGASRHLFGASLAASGSNLWVGAPGADNATGALYRFEQTDGTWSGTSRVRYAAAEERNQLAGTLAAAGGSVAVGLPGDDHNAGTMAVYSTDDESWTTAAPLVPESEDVLASMTGELRRCSDGNVGAFDCKGVDMQSFLPIGEIGGERGIELNDIWGWTDPETGTEYALVGRTNGTSFVDVSDPTNPVYVGQLPMTEGARVNSWRDIKVYADHAFVVADNAGEHGMQIFDLTQLRDVEAGEMPKTFEETALYDGIHSAHNMVINEETGYGYIVGSSGGGNTCGGGLHMLNLEDPTNPTFEGCFADRSTGRSGTGYSHDAQCVVYDGPDQEYQGREICIGFNETAVSIADVEDKDNPRAIATASYPDHAYVHQGWLTEDHRYLYQNDELDEMQGKVDNTRTLVWDVSDLDNPQLVNEKLLPEESIDHNLYVKGDRMYQSNYLSGLRILDISNPTEPEEVAHFDTEPFGKNNAGFAGSWSNYPYFESGTIVVSSIDEGLFILKESQQEM
jgi:choice-of-anchor B domain-containing protein